MFITDTLRDKVDSTLRVLEQRAVWLESTAGRSDQWWRDETVCWAAERALHVAIECSTDVANDVIDALVMREPGGYTDIIRVLVEEDVLPRPWFAQYESTLLFREKLVHGYAKVTQEEVREAVQSSAKLFVTYSTCIRNYLGMSTNS